MKSFGDFNAGSRIYVLEKNLDRLRKSIDGLQSELKDLPSIKAEHDRVLKKPQYFENGLRKCDEKHLRLNRTMGDLKGRIAEVKDKLT